jgi:hypothetical protein
MYLLVVLTLKLVFKSKGMLKMGDECLYPVDKSALVRGYLAGHMFGYAW